ncbi:hypothetical protein [Paenibacillus silvae]|uniref:hypothetical protein n=1 Tax=Paenibacillus silvae TaxID=1325358 RepID=UPI0011B7033A|nr:hypothetical protein [Paenibacillus silvae]
MGKQHVIARLRPVKDDDIRSAMSKLPVYYDEADIVREALRQFLFSHLGREPMIKGNQVIMESRINDFTEAENSDKSVDLVSNQSTVDESDDLDEKLNKFLGS